MFTEADASPTARALLTLELVQSRPGITAQSLSDRLGVTDRAARRYVGILREAGIPIESTRGPYGGYRMGRGLRLAPLMFTDAEALGLVMAVLDGHHQAGDATDPVGSALGKIVRALPESLAGQVEAIRRTAAPAPDRAAVRPDAGTTMSLVRACSGRRRLRLEYRTEAGSQWRTEVDPWSVVVRHGRWYLLCFSHAAGDRRAYRVDRIQEVELLDQPADPAPDLDPVAMLEEQLATGWEYRVDIVIDAPVAAVTRCVPATLGRLHAVDEQTCRLIGSTSNPWWYAGQLTVLPAPYRIVQCEELRQTTAALARRMLAASADGG
jgi:predicted DNA-binding transcriptional regulator YafY